MQPPLLRRMPLPALPGMLSYRRPCPLHLAHSTAAAPKRHARRAPPPPGGSIGQRRPPLPPHWKVSRLSRKLFSIPNGTQKHARRSCTCSFNPPLAEARNPVLQLTKARKKNDKEVRGTRRCLLVCTAARLLPPLPLRLARTPASEV